jgi:uncharacterized membrane protein
MPFCSQCGKPVEATDFFCGKCGARQPLSPASGSAPVDPVSRGLESLNPKTASILCYVPWVGWVFAIIVLASDRFRRDRAVRFHAFQGLYLFVAWLISDQVVRPMFFAFTNLHLYHLVQAVLLGASIFMMVKAAHEELYSLPLFGEQAQRSVAED